MKEKVTGQPMHKQEHIKNGFSKCSSSSHGVDEIEDDNVITFEGDVWDDISDSGNVHGHVEDNLSECTEIKQNDLKLNLIPEIRS